MDQSIGFGLEPGEAMRLRGAERQLWEAAERSLRHGGGKFAVVLHLSRLPGARPHHLRVARALMQDSAQRHGGQVFTMRNHDLVLLGAESPAGAAGGGGPHGLTANLARLFAADVGPEFGLTSLWDIGAEASSLISYVSGKLAEGPPAVDEAAQSGQPVSLAGLQEICARAPLAGVLRQQTGLSLARDRTLPLAARLAPAFQEIAPALDRFGVGGLLDHALADPFLRLHFAAGLDGRLVALLREDLAGRGRLLRAAVTQGLPLRLDLGLAAIVSPAFSDLARAASSAGVRLWVGVSLMQAGADLELLRHAAGVLKLTGCALVLHGIDPLAAGLFDPAELHADFVVLPCSPRLRQAAAEGIGWLAHPRLGQPAVILRDVDGEQAIAWGQARGIALFQGPFLDQVQAATRMNACHSASSCDLRQCCTRGAALSLPGRAGCGNPALLDSGFSARPVLGERL